MTSLESLLEHLDAEGLGPTFVPSDGPTRNVFVCTDDLIDPFRSRYPRLACVRSSWIDEGLIRRATRVYAACPDVTVEEELARTLARRFPDIPVVGLFGDWVVRRLGGSSEDGSADEALPADRLQKVAIFTLPRTGSTHLAGLLTESGIGRCVEHLRAPFVDLVLAAPHCAELNEKLFRHGQRNGFFSTKVISHFFLDLVRRGCGDENALAFFERHRFRVIYLHRSDRVAQALSIFAARATGIYYTKQAEFSRWQYPEYDFEAVLNAYRRFKRQEAVFQRYVERMPEVLWVTYEDLCKDVTGAMTRIFEFIGAKDRPIAESSGVERMPSGKAPEYAERFRADYARKFRAAP